MTNYQVYLVRMVNPLPRFTLLSLISAPLLAVVSIPLWRIELARENPADPFGYARSFLILSVLLTAGAGAVIGLVAVVIAYRRREAWQIVQLLTLLGNALLLFGVIAMFLTVFLAAHP